MRERPILFSAPLVRAILEGRKTQTRRVLKCEDPDAMRLLHTDPVPHGVATFGHSIPDDPCPLDIPCPYGAEGDRLWVREAHACGDMGPMREGGPIFYRADYSDSDPHVGPWRPSIHMPRWASRIDLLVTSVRAERLQEIDNLDAEAEGLIPDPADFPRDQFRVLWDQINGKRDGCSWASNPWVWVVSFRRVRP